MFNASIAPLQMSGLAATNRSPAPSNNASIDLLEYVAT